MSTPFLRRAIIANGHAQGAWPFFVKRVDLFDGYVGSGGAFLPLLDFKSNPIAFFERPKSGGIDRRVMNEDIRTVILLNEAVTFLVVEPFDNAIRHAWHPLSMDFSCFKLQAATLTNGTDIRPETAPPFGWIPGGAL